LPFPQENQSIIETVEKSTIPKSKIMKNSAFLYIYGKNLIFIISRPSFLAKVMMNYCRSEKIKKR
jgi:hypothetical protein